MPTYLLLYPMTNCCLNMYVYTFLLRETIFPADPVVDKVLKEFNCPEDVLIKCTVGNREMYVSTS